MNTVAPPPLPRDATTETGGRGGGGGGNGVSTNAANPNTSRARGIGAGGGRKGNAAGCRKGSQSSASVGTVGGSTSKMNIDGGEGFEEVETPMDARCGMGFLRENVVHFAAS